MAKWLVWFGFWFFCTPVVRAQKLEVLDLKAYQALVLKPSDTLYVVNFWATWCSPCVKELPDFLEVEKEKEKEKVRFVFVSLNSLKELDKTQQFAKSKGLPFPNYLLQAGNPNVWIDAVEKEWSGSIPFTLFYKQGRSLFFKEGELGKAELVSAINQHLNNNE
jgi:thiol-disulfide isomerase/thioredoxin